MGDQGKISEVKWGKIYNWEQEMGTQVQDEYLWKDREKQSRPYHKKTHTDADVNR